MNYRRALSAMLLSGFVLLGSFAAWFLFAHRGLPDVALLGVYSPKTEAAVKAQSCVPALVAEPTEELRQLFPVLVSNGNHLSSQIARTIFCGKNSGGHISRLVAEMRVAAQIRVRFNQSERQTIYLNHAYFGEEQYGIEQAADHYFSVKPAQLTVPDQALLVCLLRSPSMYSPYKHPEKATACRNAEIDRMVARESLSSDQAELLKDTALGVKPRPAPHVEATK